MNVSNVNSCIERSFVTVPLLFVHVYSAFSLLHPEIWSKRPVDEMLMTRVQRLNPQYSLDPVS